MEQWLQKYGKKPSDLPKPAQKAKSTRNVRIRIFLTLSNFSYYIRLFCPKNKIFFMSL